MKRRHFLLTTLLSIPAISFAKFGNFKIGKRPQKGFLVKADESRFFGKSTSAQDTYGRCIISSTDTDNQLYISDSSNLSFKEKGGPALHIHYKEDEIFYVVSGEFLFQLDKEISLAKTGDTVFIPRGTPHTFANFIENSSARMITIHQPITPELEKFYDVFCHIGYMSQEELKKQFTPEELKILYENNSFVGAPIDIDAALKKLKG